MIAIVFCTNGWISPVQSASCSQDIARLSSVSRLREEQRWFGVPDWKKDLIVRRRESIRTDDLSALSTSGAENQN